MNGTFYSLLNDASNLEYNSENAVAGLYIHAGIWSTMGDGITISNDSSIISGK